MKGMIFLGCSYTWGQGLYYYSDLPTVVQPADEYTFNKKDITDAQIKYKNKFRFARLVADEFKTFEVTRNVNGGGEDQSFEFLDDLFINNFVYEDFDYIILQISHLYRNSFVFEYEGQKYNSNIDPRHERTNPEHLFYKWYDENNISPEKWLELFNIQQATRIKEKLQFYESKGIKSKIITWQEDIIPYIENDLFLNQKFVTLSYKDKTYKSISLLQKEHMELTIKYDFQNFPKNAFLDHHPSKLCHKIIADSIIENIKKD